MKTQSSESKPPSPPTVAIGFIGDDAEDIGMKIMKLPRRDTRELHQYLVSLIDGQSTKRKPDVS